MGFRTERDQRLLQEVHVGGVDIGQVGAGLVDGGAGAVHVAKGGVGLAVIAFAGNAEDGIVAGRVATDGEDMAVIGGDQDEGFFRVHGVIGSLHSFRSGNRIGQGAGSVAGVVSVVNATAFDHEHETVVILFQ